LATFTSQTLITKLKILDGFQVELSSAKEVADIVPSIDEIKSLDSRGLIVTGPAPAGSGYDFFTRFFCPKFGIDEVISFLNLKLYIQISKLVQLITPFTIFL
jgi:hypothetical protein